MNLRPLIERLVAAGVDPIDAGEIVAEAAAAGAASAAMPAEKSKGALRTAKWRANKPSQNVTQASPRDEVGIVTQASPTVTDRHGVTPPRAHVGDIKPTSVDTRLAAVAAVDAQTDDDWPKGDLVGLLVDAAGSPWLDPTKSPDLITTAGQLMSWKRQGASWQHDVVPVVTGLCAKNRKRVGRWSYFSDAVAQSIADNRRALEIPEARVGPSGFTSFAEIRAAENEEARRLAFARMDAVANG